MKYLTLFIILLSHFSLYAKDEWMEPRIEGEMAYFRKQGSVSRSKINLLAHSKDYSRLLLVKFTIKDNRVRAEKSWPGDTYRADRIQSALEKLCQTHSIPDVEFIVSMHDEIDEEFDVPIFVMAKSRLCTKQILIPDYDALSGNYQVLGDHDITRYLVPWDKKINQLIWRGGTSQRPLTGRIGIMNTTNTHLFSRVILCELSQKYPQLIDAKFTLYAQGAQDVPYVKQFRGKYLSFEEQLNYKYHVWIDGNSCAYSNSGWKLFTSSLVFKPHSNSIQWYYPDLQPFVHYVPVKADLSDLLEKLAWVQQHDEIARGIAQNARFFALSRICQEQNLRYLYYTLLAYSKLNFTD
jgi:hypothetical protein